jgi:hypothetical protein
LIRPGQHCNALGRLFSSEGQQGISKGVVVTQLHLPSSSTSSLTTSAIPVSSEDRMCPKRGKHGILRAKEHPPSSSTCFLKMSAMGSSPLGMRLNSLYMRARSCFCGGRQAHAAAVRGLRSWCGMHAGLGHGRGWSQLITGSTAPVWTKQPTEHARFAAFHQQQPSLISFLLSQSRHASSSQGTPPHPTPPTPTHHHHHHHHHHHTHTHTPPPPNNK